MPGTDEYHRWLGQAEHTLASAQKDTRVIRPTAISTGRVLGRSKPVNMPLQRFDAASADLPTVIRLLGF